MPPGIQPPPAELADLAAWLDTLAQDLRNLAVKRMPPAVREELKRHALNCTGRAVLARTALHHAGHLAPAPAQAGGFKLGPPPKFGTVYLVLRGDGAYMGKDTDPSAGAWEWTTEPEQVRRFATWGEANEFARMVPKAQRRRCSLSVSEAEYRPTAPAGAGCEHCPAAGGPCPVCKPQDRDEYPDGSTRKGH